MTQRLPDFPLTLPAVLPRPLQASAPSTGAMDAIKAWQEIDREELFKFRAWLMPPNTPVSLSQNYMLRTEAFHHLHVEADIVRASSLYLIHRSTKQSEP